MSADINDLVMQAREIHERGAVTVAESWRQAYDELRGRIAADEQFMELVRCYGGDPCRYVPTRRARRLAVRICERLDLNPAVYLGNVFGAAADRIMARFG